MAIWRRVGMWGYEVWVAEHDRWVRGYHALPVTACLYRKPFILVRVDEVEICPGMEGIMAEAIGCLSREIPKAVETAPAQTLDWDDEETDEAE